MLADQLDYVVGVDPHRDSRAIAVVEVVSGAVVFEATVEAKSDGYARALKLVEELGVARRAFAVDGTGSFGGERVCEVGHVRRERRSGGKTDAWTLSARPERARRPDPNSRGVWPKSQVELAAGNPRFPATTRACGHLLPDGGPGVPPSPAVLQLIRTDMLNFARCMRTHGVRP
jgi:hypothetical protein